MAGACLQYSIELKPSATPMTAMAARIESLRRDLLAAIACDAETRSEGWCSVARFSRAR
jgi:hypothetical protein